MKEGASVLISLSLDKLVSAGGSTGSVTTFFFFLLKHINGSSQWHDYKSLNQHMAHAT
jgi:hypothetical protein